MSRTPDERIEWFLAHPPDRLGQCLAHTWAATVLPPQGMPSANAGLLHVQRFDRMRYDKPKRGGWMWWSSSTFGHVAIALGDGRIASTDVHGPATVGRVPAAYPSGMWGHHYVGWSDWYGEDFYCGEEDDMPLTDADVERVARAVWNIQIAESNEPKADDKPAKVYLRQAARDSATAARH